jgi:hypothetical protein
VVARIKELAAKHRNTRLLFLSASVYDRKSTLLTIYPDGKLADSITAWSNLDFNHFGGFSTYRVKDAVDGSLHDFGLLMGIGNMDTHRRAELAATKGLDYKGPDIPKLPDISDIGPSFIVVSGDPESPAMDTLEQIHDLYRVEGVRMEQAYRAREMARAERKAYLLANPPKPQDVTIQFWKRQETSSGDIQPRGEGEQP